MDMLSPEEHLRNYQKDMLGQILKAWTVHKNVMVANPKGMDCTQKRDGTDAHRYRQNAPAFFVG